MVNTSIIPQNVDLKDLSLIAGFHGIGATGYVSIKYLIDQLKPEKVASVDTDAIFPVSSNSSGQLVTPYQIYKHNKLAILRAEISPSRKSELLFLRQLCDLLLDKKIKELILIGGLDSAFKTDDSMVRYVHTSSFTPNQNFDNLKLLEDDRIIVGPVALMLNYMEMKTIKRNRKCRSGFIPQSRRRKFRKKKVDSNEIDDITESLKNMQVIH